MPQPGWPIKTYVNSFTGVDMVVMLIVAKTWGLLLEMTEIQAFVEKA